MRVVTHGATDQSVELYIVDADGLPATGLAYNSSGIDLWYRRNGAAVTSITEATQTASGAHSDGGFVGLGNGVYRLDPPDAAFASGVSHVTFGGTLTGYTVYPVTVQLSAFDLQTAVQSVNVAQISGDSTAADNAESFFDGTGYAGTGNVIPTVTTVNGLGAGVITATSIASDAITAAKVATDVTTEIQSGLATASALSTVAGYLDTEIASIISTLGSAGAGLTAVPWNAAWDAEVQSEVSDALVAGNVMTTGDSITIDNTALDDMWSRWMNTATSDTGAGETGRAIHYLAAAFASSGVFSEAALANAPSGGGGGGSTVDADVVDDSRTWFATDNKARNIITLGDNFAGTLAMAPDLNPGTTILTVDSVSITGAATVTATGLTVNRAKTRAHFTVPALTTTGTYTVIVTVTTIDGQVIPTTATLRVQ